MTQVCQTTGKVRLPKGSAGFTIIPEKDNGSKHLRKPAWDAQHHPITDPDPPARGSAKATAKPNDIKHLAIPVVSSTYANHAKLLQIVARSRCA